MTNHVVLCGLGKVGVSTLEILHSLGLEVVVIARDMPAEWAIRVQRWASAVILDDERDDRALIEADLPNARALIVATDDDLANLETALYAGELAPNVPIVLRLYDRQLGERVRQRMAVRAVLNAGDVAAGSFVAAILGDARIRTTVAGQYGVLVEEQSITETEAGLTVDALADRMNGIPIGLAGMQNGEVGLADRSVPLPVGATLIVAQAVQTTAGNCPDQARSVCTGKRRAARRRALATTLLAGLWRSSSPAMKWAFAAFASAIAVGIVVFRVALGLSWLDSLYFTASIVTTVGFGDITLLHAPPLVKLFGIGLMLSGAALLVIVFGIVTDYLVSVRVEQALGYPRSKLEGHVVVAGVGNLGHRVATDLLRLGEQVLAVDQRSDLRFVNPLGDHVTVIHGDASDERVIEQAGIKQARAVAVVTDNDVVNLRIAEMAKTLNPAIRTVVRVFSTRIVGRLGTSALGVDVVLNPSLAAGATFAACALAPNVHQGFRYRGRLLMLRSADRALTRQWAGKTVREARTSGQLAILLRRRPGQDAASVVGPHDTIGLDDELIVLDEYCSRTGQVEACVMSSD